MKVLLTGAGGMLGQDVYKAFETGGWEILATDIDVNEDWLEYGDVREYAPMLATARNFGPDLIINLAALTDLEECESHPQNAWLTNAMGAENMCLIANELGAKLVYISTAGIFDGERSSYNDFHKPAPLSVYGQAKYYGETFCLENAAYGHYVFRAGWMMGGFEKDKKFVKKIIDQLRAGETQILAVDDKWGTPTYTKDFAESILAHVSSSNTPEGLYNQVCGGKCNRHMVADAIVKRLDDHFPAKALIVKSGVFDHEYFAPRPECESLVNMKLDARGRNFMRHWEVCLAEYLDEWKKLL